MADHDTTADADDELTSEAAAELLHVSVAYANALADSGALGVVQRTDESRRLISRAAVLQHKGLTMARQLAGLDSMVAASHQLGLYDAELEGLPEKRAADRRAAERMTKNPSREAEV